ncbi:putative cysteine-rich receptor-like protein kinase 9 isoform X1 [Ziziphus jujuba]|uniref:Cysteine-rich receptor-like protein kinase 9 isoform X1 n=1 Tax=Ziziphus jujuba TaxID=326968 RepID=A0A6P3ZWW4_ZIZJJ|nr:putative cysteine-rich receptor-like protein kinase 9 isoform X1 [Ziziphus jujuba]
MALIFMLLCFLISLGTKSEAAPTYLYHNCTNTTTFTPNSIYQTNLNHLLSVLSSNSSVEFYKATAGQDPSNSVHGLFLCRGDVNTTACRDCVTTATKEVIRRCPVEKQNIIWYDECQLRYSNRSFFGTVDVLPRIALINTANITEPDRFRRILNATVKAAAAEAANGGDKKYATKEAYVSGFQTLYSLVQCTPDLSTADCNRCLVLAIERLYKFSERLGARVLFPSCNVRYELYPFYYNRTSSPSPTMPKGSSKISTGTIVAIVVPIAATLLLFILGFCFLVRRAKQKSNAGKKENAETDMPTKGIEFNQSTRKAMPLAVNEALNTKAKPFDA